MSTSPSTVLALIPARAGSKGVPNKNVRIVAGKPLLAWSIEHALASRLVDRVIVSTDSPIYRQIALDFGAEAPFLRPDDISGDHATDLEVFQHALDWLRTHEGYEPGIVVHLRPTCPIRAAGLIDRAIELLADESDLDSVRTIAETPLTPFKMWLREPTGRLKAAMQLDSNDEPWNAPRQSLPVSYIQTANVDAVRATVITDRNSMTGSRIHGLVESHFYDIDTEEELQRAARSLQLTVMPDQVAWSFCFDIDGVIATITRDNDYRLAKPIPSTIEMINRLFDAGNHITLFTARGSVTGKDWATLTSEQMVAWGVKHHQLLLGKPAADYYIDDKMVSTGELAHIVARLTGNNTEQQE